LCAINCRVLQSYQRRDVALALEGWRKDQEIDALNSALFRELLTYMMENPRNITFCTTCFFARRTSSARVIMPPISRRRLLHRGGTSAQGGASQSRRHQHGSAAVAFVIERTAEEVRLCESDAGHASIDLNQLFRRELDYKIYGNRSDGGNTEVGRKPHPKVKKLAWPKPSDSSSRR
jgi:hypothetical protein